MNFRPYSIWHVQLDQISDTRLDPGNYFLILWWKKVPMGHVWMEDGVDSINLADEKIRRAVADAIAPAMDYYLQDAAEDLIRWRSIWVGGNQFLWNSILERWLPKPDESISTSDTGLSVIVCTRNRTQALSTCIASLMNQSDRAFELIVVDNAPDDDQTMTLLLQYPSIRYVREERAGLDFARNKGIQ